MEKKPRKEVYDSRYDALIERMPDMEKGVEITLDCISVNYHKGDRMLEVFCSVRSVPGKKIKSSIGRSVVLHDLTGRIVDKVDQHLYWEDWMGFAVKEFSFRDMPLCKVAALGKMRIIPTKAGWN